MSYSMKEQKGNIVVTTCYFLSNFTQQLLCLSDVKEYLFQQVGNLALAARFGQLDMRFFGMLCDDIVMKYLMHVEHGTGSAVALP